MAGVHPCCRCLAGFSVQVASRQSFGALIPRRALLNRLMKKEMSSAHDEAADPAAPEILDPLLSPPGEVHAYVMNARVDNAHRCARVAASIAKQADRMVARSVKTLHPLAVGDIVRISVLASARIRRRLKTIPHFRGRVGSWWTRSLFRVVRVTSRADGGSRVTQLFQVEPAADADGGVCHGIDWSQWFTRAYLKYAPVVHSARWRS